jgi:hypothetical protein
MNRQLAEHSWHVHDTELVAESSRASVTLSLPRERSSERVCGLAVTPGCAVLDASSATVGLSRLVQVRTPLSPLPSGFRGIGRKAF